VVWHTWRRGRRSMKSNRHMNMGVGHNIWMGISSMGRHILRMDSNMDRLCRKQLLSSMDHSLGSSSLTSMEKHIWSSMRRPRFRRSLTSDMDLNSFHHASQHRASHKPSSFGIGPCLGPGIRPGVGPSAGLLAFVLRAIAELAFNC